MSDLFGTPEGVPYMAGEYVPSITSAVDGRQHVPTPVRHAGHSVRLFGFESCALLDGYVTAASVAYRASYSASFAGSGLSWLSPRIIGWLVFRSRNAGHAGRLLSTSVIPTVSEDVGSEARLYAS